MKTIQPFIDLGFHTIPLKGELKRLENGKKTIPQFELNWKTKYKDKFNNEATEIGCLLTGAISGILAIDCDDQTTYDLFKSLDLNNKWHFISKGKLLGGGTIIYKFDEDIETFSIQNKTIALDIFSNNGMVYLPSDANTTKEQWPQETLAELPNLVEMPATVKMLLLNLQQQYKLSKTNNSNEISITNSYANYLAPQLEIFVKDKKFMPSLFKVITPKSFRDLPDYVQHGYLHPDKVPNHRGSEYFSKLSAILGADVSVSKELYSNTIYTINNLWSEPMLRPRLESTILNPMLTGTASVNNESIWKYDEHWETRGIMFTTKLGEAAEIFFDDIKVAYYLINYTRSDLKIFYKEADALSYIETIGIGIPQRKNMKHLMPIVRTVMEPALPFGFYIKDSYHRQFNVFQQSRGLAILNDSTIYKKFYKKPTTIINYLETFIPDNFMRNYLLGFLKRKLTSFSYSPVILYFLGTHGSGKDTLVALLESILSDNYIAKPTTKEFLEQYNGWLVDKYFVQLDEYGNQLSRSADKQEALGKLKYYTGKENIQIRQMRTDGYKYNHKATFIMTANTNPLLIEDEDRRVALFDTPNILKDADWVKELGGIVATRNKMFTEINDFCYYLATEVNSLTADDYVSPPYTKGKQDLIASKLPAAHRLAFYFKNSMWDNIKSVMLDYNVPNLLEDVNNCRIFEDDLYLLYNAMTDGRGTKPGLSKVMRENDFEKIPTTKDGLKAYYYYFKTLKGLPSHKPFKDETIITKHKINLN